MDEHGSTTEYPPRANRELYPLRTPQVHFETIGPAWSMIGKSYGVWIPATLLTLIMVGAAYFLSMMPVTFMTLDDPTSTPNQLLVSVLQVPGMIVLLCLNAGLYAMAVRQINGDVIEVGDMFDGFKIAVPAAIVATLYGGLMFVLGEATVLLTEATNSIVPAIVLGLVILALSLVAIGVYTYWGVLHLISQLTLKETMVLAFTRTIRQWFGLVALTILLSFIIIVSAFLCFVPMLLTLPMMFLVFAAHFRYFFPEYAGYGLDADPQN